MNAPSALARVAVTLDWPSVGTYVPMLQPARSPVHAPTMAPFWVLMALRVKVSIGETTPHII